MRSRRRPFAPDLPLPKRPFRDSALFNAVLAILIVAVSWFTGGTPWKAVVVAIAFFVVATAWSWWRFRVRLEREANQP